MSHVWTILRSQHGLEAPSSELLVPGLVFLFKLLCFIQVWKAILSGPLALLSVALSTADNPFPTKKMSGEKCVSWTKAIDLELVKEIKTKTGNEHATKLNVNLVTNLPQTPTLLWPV